MEQIESFGQSIYQFLVLGRIFTQIDFRLSVAGIIVVLPARQEIVVRLIVVLIKDGQTYLFSQFPAIVEVWIARMRTRSGRTDDDNLRMGFGDALIDILETLDKLR